MKKDGRPKSQILNKADNIVTLICNSNLWRYTVFKMPMFKIPMFNLDVADVLGFF